MFLQHKWQFRHHKSVISNICRMSLLQIRFHLVNFGFSILEKMRNLAHEKLIIMEGGNG